ncbi:alpha/beta hydrolase [Catenovulum maritimum]|uniref:Serine aminopeptidase S33 domain-containing protein n=1 Tax=Catenovulum maritimum TaxID=1513271 RepID=A0A0J8GLK0_9ALTE|nr:alpha/beta hydrolase [Catenovulum maritimum]KMT63682.1 hypothetical protein XM47_18445 [Catenovulum maritimum]
MTTSTDTCILMLRGLMREQAHWKSFIEKLSIQQKLYPVIAIDIAGNGTECKRNSFTTISACRQDIQVRFNTKYPNCKKIILIGISMGGMIALDWAKNEPNKIIKLCVLNTSAANLVPFYLRLNLAKITDLIKIIIDHKSREKTILNLTSNVYKNNDCIIECWNKIQDRRPVSRLNIFRQIYAAARFKADSVNVDCLIIACRKDKLVDYQASVKLAKLLSCKLVINDTAGHDIALDAPDFLLDQITEWLAN